MGDDKNQTVVVALIDLDGCLFHAAAGPNADVSDQHVVSSNKLFLHHIKELAEKREAKIIELAIGSARQSADYDSLNCLLNKSRTMVGALEACRMYLSNLASFEVSFNSFLMADAWSSLKPGSAYQQLCDLWRQSRTLSELDDEKKEQLENCYQTIADETKWTLLYAHAHNCAVRYPDAEIVLALYDDKAAKFNRHAGNFFRENPELLPSNVAIHLYEYTGGITPKPAVEQHYIVQGSGEINYSSDDTLWQWLPQMYKNLDRRSLNLSSLQHLPDCVRLTKPKTEIIERVKQLASLYYVNGVGLKKEPVLVAEPTTPPRAAGSKPIPKGTPPRAARSQPTSQGTPPRAGFGGTTTQGLLTGPLAEPPSLVMIANAEMIPPDDSKQQKPTKKIQSTSVAPQPHKYNTSDIHRDGEIVASIMQHYRPLSKICCGAWGSYKWDTNPATLDDFVNYLNETKTNKRSASRNALGRALKKAKPCGKTSVLLRTVQDDTTGKYQSEQIRKILALKC